EGGALDVFEQGGCVLELRLAGPLAPEAIDQWLAGAPAGARTEVDWPALRFRFDGPSVDERAADALCDEVAHVAYDELRLLIATHFMVREIPGYNATQIRVFTGLQSVRFRPRMYVGDIEDPRTLVRMLLRAWAGDVVAGRGVGLELESPGESLALRVTQPPWPDDSRALDRFAFADQAHHGIGDGSFAFAARAANALSTSFAVRATVNGVPREQRWRIGRRMGGLTELIRPCTSGLELEFTPDPIIFGKPLTLAMVQHEATRVAMSVPTSLRVNGTLISFPNFEPLAREIIGVTPLWSDRLLVFDVNLDEVRVQLAIGFSDEREAPLRFLENADEVRPDQHMARDSFCRALRAAVDLKSARKPAPLHHVTGVISAHRRTSRWAPNPLVPALRTEAVKRLSQGLAVFLDEVALARERLRASWTGPRG
ncbi:MAG: hypothetical protein SFW67_05305, partial [Myxococcaceae bacterium]|nr:hypothetical protein [Myxococcaceae bacterium]